MSTEHNATDGRIYGRVEREANDVVLFISDQGRRIRFRYIRMSLQCPNAAEYQCMQCPITALMINANFRIVDPCTGHDCSAGACHPQWTPPTDARTAMSAQQSPGMQALASCHPQWTPQTNVLTAMSAQQSPAPTALARQSRHVKPAKKVIAEAVYDANGCIQWRSDRHEGTTLKFSPKTKPGSLRRHFYCSACATKCTKYESCLAAFGIKRRYLVVLGDSIIDHHPDDVGTNQGHLCQQPLLEEKMQAKRPRASCAESDDGMTLGKMRAMVPSTPMQAENLVWYRAPNIHKGAMRGKKLIPHTSQKHQRQFKFILAGPSSLDEHAFDYYCLDCWLNHGEKCHVTVHSSTQEFIITDPDQTSSGRHACVQPSARPAGSPAVSKDAPSGLEHVGAESLQNEKQLHIGGAVCEERGELSYKRMRDATHGSSSDSAVRTSIHTQGVDGSRAGTRQCDDADRTPIDAQAELSHPRDSAVDESTTKPIPEATDTISDGSSDFDLGLAVDALDEALQYPESTYSVSSAALCATDSRADTSHQSEVDVSTTQLDAEGEQKPHRSVEQRAVASVDVSNHPWPTTLKTNGTNLVAGCAATSGTRKRHAGSSVNVKPTKQSPEVLTIDDSDEDTDANGASSATGRKKPAKRESVKTNDGDRLQEDPDGRFHRFIREVGLVDEYASYTFASTGKPAAFVQRPHVMDMWIKFIQRN